MKQVILILTTFFIFSCSASKKVVSNDDIFLAVKEVSVKKKCGLYPDMYYENKKRLNDKINFLNISNDTIFLIQEYDIQSGELRESIWNKISKIEYVSLRGEIRVPKIQLFDTEIYDSVNSWSFKIGNRKSRDFGSNDVVVYRIIIKQNKVNIDCEVL